MVEVYFFMPVNEVDIAVECGIKLSKWFDKEVVIEGERRKCILALLNPKDDIKKYNSGEYRCLKLELDPKYCFVADNFLYQVGLGSLDTMKMYTSSIIPLKDYIFGSYRLPECLVTSTVIAGRVAVLDKRLDSPVLYDNSEGLYMNNIFETYKEEHDDFNDAVLYYFYCKLAEVDKYTKTEDNDKEIAVFVDKTTGRVITIKIPDISGY